MSQFLARLGYGLAHGRADLNLALQEFGADAAFQFRLAVGHQRVGCGDEIARLAINEKILFFDSESEAGSERDHDASSVDRNPRGAQAPKRHDADCLRQHRDDVQVLVEDQEKVGADDQPGEQPDDALAQARVALVGGAGAQQDDRDNAKGVWYAQLQCDGIVAVEEEII